MAKTAKSRFASPFRGLRSNGPSTARWKARGRLPISANWTFVASLHGWGAMSGYWSKFRCSKRVGSLWVQISGGRESPWPITWCCLRGPTFSRFDIIPACDTQTDSDDGYYPRIASAARVKTTVFYIVRLIMTSRYRRYSNQHQPAAEVGMCRLIITIKFL